MSNLSINQASKLFKVSRNTVYARIKKGDITKDSEGLVSAKDMVRLICAELAGDFHLGYARQLTDKSSLLFDLAF